MALFFLKPSLLEENGVSNSCSNSFVVCTSFSKVIVCEPLQVHDERIFTFFKNVFFFQSTRQFMFIYIYYIYIQYLHVSCYRFIFIIHSYISVSLYIHIFHTLSIELKSIEHSLHPIHRYHNCFDISASRAPQK